LTDQTLSRQFDAAERDFVQADRELKADERQLSQVRTEKASLLREQPRESPVSPDKFTPMKMANEPQLPEPETFSGEADGIRAAANELKQRREESAPPTVRQYNQVGGPQQGERSPSHQTRTAKEAAEDLARLRRAEADAQEVLAAHYLQKELDAEQNAQAPQRDANGRFTNNEPDQFQPVAQPDQFQPDQFQPQPESPAVSEGADPELVKAFQNPKIRGGVQHALDQAESQRQQYVQATQMALEQAALASIAAIPELQGLNVEQARGALQQISRTDPKRFLEINGHLQRIEQFRQIAMQQSAAQQQQQQAQQQRVAQQTQTWMNQQDDAFEKWAESKPAEEVKAVRGAAIDTLVNHYGIDRNELAQLWNSNPLMRSLPVQKLLYDLTRFHMAQESIRPVRNVPKVMRPGTADDFGYVDRTGVAEAYRAFEADSTPRKAAAVLSARRQAAARQNRR
jgi:hypothetical protein